MVRGLRLWLCAAGLASAAGGAACGAPAWSAASEGTNRSRPAIDLTVVPDDGTAALLDAIRSARRRVWVQMYMLTSPDALAALVAAHRGGAEVRVLLEPSPYGAPEANQVAFGALVQAGIDVRWTGRARGLVHTKLVLVDDVTAYVMTLNLTTAGLRSNREYIVVDSDPADVRRLQGVWTADAIGGEPVAGDGRGRLLLSPIDARARLAAAIDGARATIALQIEEISDSMLVDRLLDAHARGVGLTVVAPAGGTSAATAAALGRMSAGGIVVYSLASPAVHAKAMVIDGRLIYVGSINFTRASLDDNREVGVLMESPSLAGRIGATIQTDAAAATRL